MNGSKTLPYREALPYLLKQNGWTYRELDYRTRKSASYWNQTVTGRQGVPQNPAVYERLAEIFDVSPDFFIEYNQLKAAALVLRDPSLAYRVRKRKADASVPVTVFRRAENIKRSSPGATVPAFARADFAVRVRGDSLRAVGVLDGDLVYVRRDLVAKTGNLVLALADGVATLRFFERADGRTTLLAGDPARSAITPDALELVGVCVALVRESLLSKPKKPRL